MKNFEPSIVSRTIRKRRIPRHGDNSVQITTKQLRWLVDNTTRSPVREPTKSELGSNTNTNSTPSKLSMTSGRSVSASEADRRASPTSSFSRSLAAVGASSANLGLR
ncbi:hypothetical protein PENSUB_12526 [Penicillium subrubescens]|uniref:Uncharacterized protein n=1 Tax=Penicillium subrubescens TaxID=1316194 RepID=A0A1Q5SYI4_9EURO|nr:hypothetical protein PENSUB_12526 [Penicillium subrubescens]